MQNLSGISPIFLIILAVVFLLLVIEIFYLLRKRKGNVSSTNVVPNPSTGVTGDNTSQTIVTSSVKRHIPWKIILPLSAIGLVGIIILVAAAFLRKPTPQQELRGRALYDNCFQITKFCNEGCSTGANQSEAWADGYITNTSCDTPKAVSFYIIKAWCSYVNTSVNGGCGDHATPQKIDVPPLERGQAFHFTKEMTKQAVGGNGSCGSAQVDISFTGNVNDPDARGATAYLAPCKYNACDTSTSSCVQKDCVQGVNCQDSCTNDNECKPSSTPTPTRTPTPTLTPPPGATRTPTPSVTPSPTPTLPPGVTPSLTPAPMCTSINFYSVDLNATPPNLFVKKLTIENLKDLHPGDKINITVFGSSNTTKGQVRVNGGCAESYCKNGWHDLTQRRSGCSGGADCPLIVTDELYDPVPNNLYQIPPGVINFKFEGRTQ